MSPELIAVLTTGVTLADGQLGTVLWLTARLDRNIQQVHAETHADLQQIRGDIRALETRVGPIEQGQARLEGLVDGLQEAIAGRAAPTA